MADGADRPQDSAKTKADALALAEQAEAEAAEAEALAAAARARARAIKLRREAQVAAEAEVEAEPDAQPGEADEAPGEADAATVADEPTETAETPDTAEAAEPGPARRRLRVSNVPLILGAAAVVAIVGLLGASGWMFWRHQNVVHERQQAAAYIATARQGVVNLTSLDFNKSKQDVQRILDSATGDFRDQVQKTAEDFASVVKDTKAVAEGTVSAAAVESMNRDSAVVLVLANERVTNAAGAKDQPRTFRFRVSVVHDGDQLKLSKVEFVL
jgi:Mce-associated membrane protein